MLHAWKQTLKVSYKKSHTTVKAILLLGHTNWEHLHNLAHRHSRVIHELARFIFGAGHHESLAHRVQVVSGVD
jgi:hypothetical protein